MTTSANTLVAEPKIYFDPTYSSVPDQMKQVDQWLAFRVSWNPETVHFDKTPLNSKGNVTNDHQGGESFATMLEYTKRNPNTVLGFYVRPPFIAIDLDGGVEKEATDITDWASAIIREIGSYTELSPSGTGIHIIGLGTKPGPKSKIGNVEIYTDKRALTVTSLTVNGFENLNQVDVTNVYNKMVNREYVFGESKYERVLNERASSGEGNKIHYAGHVFTSLLTLLSTGDYTPDAKPFRVTDRHDNWIEYWSQSEAIGAFLVCAARKYDCDSELIEQAYLDSHLSDTPKWANGKWERLGKSEIQTAIDLVNKPQQAPAKEQPAATATVNTTAPQTPPAATTAAVESLPWEKPRPFNIGLPPVTPFDIRCLPLCLRALVQDASELIGVPIEFAAAAVLSALAGAVGRRAFVYPREFNKKWKESLNLWGGLIAGPGDKKTPLMNAIFEPLNRIRLEWDKEYAMLEEAYKNKLDQHEKEVKKIEAANKKREKERDKAKSEKSILLTAEDVGKLVSKDDVGKQVRQSVVEVPANEQPPVPPVPPFKRVFMVNEGTPEWLQDANAMNPEGLFSVRDELSGLVVEMDSKGRELERPLWLAAWSGNTVYGVGRLSREGKTGVLCWSLFGGFQPDTVRKFLESCMDVVDGLFPRFQVFVWPDPLDAAGRKGADRPADEEAIRSTEKIFRTLLEMKEEQLEFHFAKGEAQETFNQWYDDLSARIAAEPTTHMRIHLAKYAGLMPILAGLFQLADIVAAYNEHSKLGDAPLSGSREIDVEHAKQAITTVNWLESHARRIYSCIKSPFRVSMESLAKHLCDGDLEDGFTVRDVRLNNWKHLGENAEIEDAVTGFEELDWLRQRAPKSNPKGGRPTKVWDINPALKEKT